MRSQACPFLKILCISSASKRLSRESWYKMNHDKHGKRYKRHRPYTIPADAEELVDCLGEDDEQRAKAIFQRHAYGIVNK